MPEIAIFLQENHGRIKSKAFILEQIGEAGFSYIRANNHLLFVYNNMYLVSKEEIQ